VSAVTDLLDQLVAGRKTVDEVAEEFRTYAWPVTREPTTDPAEGFRRDIEDPEEPVEGSFFDVSLYRTLGKINMDQYEVLAEAAAEAMQGSGDESAEVIPGDDEPPAGGVDPEDETAVLFD
jgi:hypothetical protein